MAKKDNNKDVTNISNVISQMGTNSERLNSQFQEAISSGQKLNKAMTDLAKKGYENVNKALRENQRLQEPYLKNIGRLNEDQIKQLNILQRNEKTLSKGGESLRALTMELGSASASTELFALAVAGAEATVSMGLTVAIQALMAALQLMSGGLGLIISLYQNWNELMGQTVQSMSQLALATGATGDQLDQLQGIVGDLSDDFAALGGSVVGIEEAAGFISELSVSLRDTRLLTDELATSMLEMTRVFGLSTDQATDLFRLLESGSTGSHQSLADFGVEMDIFAHSIGALSGQVVQDFANSSDYVARFGRDGVDAFRHAATQAQAFGFEARQIFEMAAQFNTFQQASESVNQLNAMLGTSISSFELISEQDPAARIEMLRQAIMGSGQAWADMDQYQRQAIANSLNLSEQEAARLFDENISYAQLQQEQEAAQAAEEARNIRRETSEQQMADLLARTSSLWDSIDRVIERISYHVSTLLGPLFGEVRGTSLDIFDSIDQWLTRMEESGEAQNFIQGMVNAYERTQNFILGAINALGRMRTIVEEIYNYFMPIVNALTTADFPVLRSLSDMATGGLESLIAPVAGAPSVGGVGASAAIQQAAEGQQRQREASGTATSLRTAQASDIGAAIEREYGSEIENYISNIFNEEGGNSIINTIAETIEHATSATSTAPVTGKTTTASSSQGSSSQVSIVPSDVNLDSRTIGQIFWQVSARA